MKLVASVAERTWDRTLALLARAEELADGVEVRVDAVGVSPAEDPETWLTRILGATSKPLVLTYRPREEGGWAEVGRAERATFWSMVIAWIERRADLRSRVVYDLEMDLVEIFRARARDVPWERVIVSHHRDESSSEEVEALYEHMATLPAHIVKIAFAVRDVGETLPIFRILARARQEGRAVVGIAMGSAGVITRILGLAYGSAFTYGAVETGRESAPGQLSLADLRHLYRVTELSERTAVVGVIGYPVGHSLSPRVHNVSFQRLGLDFVYVPLEVRALDRFMEDFVRPQTRLFWWPLRGVSVTSPHKVAVMRWLDEVDALAQRVGAVNTILVEGERLHGYNTDVEGGIEPLRARADVNGARVAIVGNGGAARALAYGVKEQGARVLLFGRHRERVRAVAEEIGAEAHELAELSHIPFDILIHATPVGMAGYPEQSLIPEAALRHRPLVYDLVYTPPMTPLLRMAEQMGCPVLSGVEMFVRQAAAQFRLWTGQEPPLEAMRACVYSVAHQREREDARRDD